MSSERPEVVAIGECMLELSGGDRDWRMGFGGDVLNTAVYLSRLGIPTAFLSAVGDDPFSQRMREDWAREGLHLMLAELPGGLPGLYAIENTSSGERSFHYWRQQSAARQLFRSPRADDYCDQAANADILYLSGITLAIFDAPDRSRLYRLAGECIARGGSVVFDPNYRVALWADPAEARTEFDRFVSLSAMVFPSLEDMHRLYGDERASDVLDRWSDGSAEIVVKMGGEGCSLEDGTIVQPQDGVYPVDTTGAGDAFNAGYMAKRLSKATRAEAATFANSLAGAVVGKPGAILAASDFNAFMLTHDQEWPHP